MLATNECIAGEVLGGSWSWFVSHAGEPASVDDSGVLAESLEAVEDEIERRAKFGLIVTPPQR